VTYTNGVIQLGAGSDPLKVRLDSQHSGGELSVVEMAMAAGTAGPPLHVHPTHGEGFYVLAGELTLQVGDQIVTGGPGTWVFAPRNVPHTLANHAGQDARVLCIFAPGGFERRFARMLGGDVTDELSEAERATKVLGPPLPGTSDEGQRGPAFPRRSMNDER
jgi:quercetin dioxygenase-like cupin family protein